MLELFLEALALGHVSHREDDPLDGRIAQEIVRDHLDMTPRSIVVPDAPLCGDGQTRAKRNSGVDSQRLFDVFGVEDLGDSLTLELARLITEDPCRGRRLVCDGRVGSCNEDDVRGVLDECLESGLAPTGVEALGERLAVKCELCLSGKVSIALVSTTGGHSRC